MDEDAGGDGDDELAVGLMDCARLGHDWQAREVVLTLDGADTFSVCTRCGTEGVQGAAGRRPRPPLPEIRYVRGELDEH